MSNLLSSPKRNMGQPFHCTNAVEDLAHRVFSEEDRLARERWMRLHYEDANNPEVRSVDVYNLQGEFALTYVSARELALELGITQEEVEVAAANEGIIKGSYQVKFENDWWVRAKQTTSNNHTMSQQPNSSSVDQDQIMLNQGTDFMAFTMQATTFPRQSIRDRKARLAECKCPVHDTPMIMIEQLEIDHDFYTVVKCSHRLCHIKAFAGTPTDIVSLFPQFGYLIRSY